MANVEATKRSRCGWKTILLGITLGVAGWLLLPCVLLGAVWLGDGDIGWPLSKVPDSVLLWIVLIPGGAAMGWYLRTDRSQRIGCLVAGLSAGLVVTPMLAWVVAVLMLPGGMT